MTTIKDVYNSDNLDALIDNLRGLSDEDWESIDCTDLPCWGPDIEDTAEVYAWDDKRILLMGPGPGRHVDLGERCHLEDRCPVCGEATFHCTHTGEED